VQVYITQAHPAVGSLMFGARMLFHLFNRFDSATGGIPLRRLMTINAIGLALITLLPAARRRDGAAAGMVFASAVVLGLDAIAAIWELSPSRNRTGAGTAGQLAKFRRSPPE
jgi:hypothetical protein